MLIYVAHPIDKSNQHARAKVSGALAALGGGRAHLNGNHLYLPSAAFKLGPGAKPDTTINQINATALYESQAVLALWPRDTKSWGVPIEVDRAVQDGKRVALVVEEDPTWAMMYGGNFLEVFKVDPKEFDGFTMATLRAMDWLTGHDRTEAQVLRHPSHGKPGDETTGEFYARVNKIAKQAVAEANGEVLGSRIVAGQTVITKDGHGTIPFLSQKTDPPSAHETLSNIDISRIEGFNAQERAKKEPGALPTDEEAQKDDKSKGEPTEPRRDPLEVRSLASFIEMDGQAKLPTRGYETDAGLDIYVSETTTIDPHSFADVRSHIAVNMPDGHWGYLVGRSSTLRKKGLLVNPGVIDNGYTGELYSALWNLTSEPVTIQAGERVAQLILLPNITPNFDPEWVAEARSSVRGKRGFGSSGV